MKKVCALLIFVGLCAAAFISSPTATSQGRNDKLRKNKNKIENNYIVVLDDQWVGEKGKFSISPYIAAEMSAMHKGQLKHVFQHAINGFAVEMTPEEAEALSNDYRVEYVEEDGVVTADVTQNNPPWGLDRIDQRNRPLSATYTYNFTGSGVRAYVIDTGIRTTHTQFGGRASNVFDAFGGNGADCNGHGTHVSGTIGGSTYGVAKSALLRGVRVLDCNGSGSTSGCSVLHRWYHEGDCIHELPQCVESGGRGGFGGCPEHVGAGTDGPGAGQELSGGAGPGQGLPRRARPLRRAAGPG